VKAKVKLTTWLGSPDVVWSQIGQFTICKLIIGSEQPKGGLLPAGTCQIPPFGSKSYLRRPVMRPDTVMPLAVLSPLAGFYSLSVVEN
jgi:hypothetical protein